METKLNGHTTMAGLEKPPVTALDPMFITTRVFRAQKAQVYKAWTDPELMSRWWGPNQFTVPVCEMDVRPGGAFRIVMRSPDGTDYPLKGEFHVVIEGERLVFSQNWEEHPASWQEMLLKNGADMSSKEALTKVSFEEMDGKTLLTIRMLFDSSAARNAMLKIGMQEGWSESLDRLGALLKGQ